MPGLCAVALVVGAATGGRVVWTSSQTNDVVSLATGAAGCSFDGDDCRSTGCCVSSTSQCFKKNHHWASCNESCSRNRRWSHGQWIDTPDPVWECWTLSRQIPGAPPASDVDDVEAAPTPELDDVDDVEAAPTPELDDEQKLDDALVPAPAPVPEPALASPVCSRDGSDCSLTGCCERAGSRCYRKNDHWASCNETCLQFSKWSHHHQRW